MIALSRRRLFSLLAGVACAPMTAASRPLRTVATVDDSVWTRAPGYEVWEGGRRDYPSRIQSIEQIITTLLRPIRKGEVFEVSTYHTPQGVADCSINTFDPPLFDGSRLGHTCRCCDEDSDRDAPDPSCPTCAGRGHIPEDPTLVRSAPTPMQPLIRTPT